MLMLYLASQSARRKEILKEMKIPFRVVKSTYVERMPKGMLASKLVQMHALGKAQKAIAPKSARLILGSDTIVKVGNEILGKPKTRKQAREMLEKISGRTHYVMTGVTILDPAKNKVFSGVEKTKVFVKKLSAKAMSDYHKQINPMDKAGAYAIQASPKIVQKIEGSYSNVVGLPKVLVRKLLKEALR